MAALTLYIKDATAGGGGAHGSLQDGGSAPGTATTATGWKPAKTASGNYSLLLYGTERTSSTFATTPVEPSTNPTTSDCYRTENPLTGTFASANWTVAVQVIASGATIAGGRLGVRVWRSANANGSGATQITGARVVTNIATTLTTSTAQNLSVTFNPGSVSLNEPQHVFVQFGWEITTASSSNSSAVRIRTDATNSKVTTADFTPAFTGTGSANVSSTSADASGEETFSGTASGAVSSGTAAAAGEETFAGTGSAAVASVDASGSGSVGEGGSTGSGSAEVSVGAASGSALETFEGSGSAGVASASSTASASESFAGAADGVIASAVADGTAEVGFDGSGTSGLASVEASALAALEMSGTGQAAVSPASASAACGLIFAGAASGEIAHPGAIGEALEALEGEAASALSSAAAVGLGISGNGLIGEATAEVARAEGAAVAAEAFTSTGSAGLLAASGAGAGSAGGHEVTLPLPSALAIGQAIHVTTRRRRAQPTATGSPVAPQATGRVPR